MADMKIIRGWDDEELIRELRSGIRARDPQPDFYMAIMAEALARILERIALDAINGEDYPIALGE